jgi:hypothetical protein
MKSFVLLIGLLIITSPYLNAQDFVQIAAGANYAEQALHDLETGATTQMSNESWDLAFTAWGLQDGGIHVNEAAISTFTTSAPAVELYLADTTDFASVTAFDSTFTRLYNDEESWTYGAVNAPRSLMNPFDYGWGTYSPASNQVVGDKVYVIKLRSGAFKKFIVESLIVSTYTIKYADLDGQNEMTATIDKTNFADLGLAFFSFDTGTTIDVGINKFDFVFTRYVTPLDDGEGNILDYNVTGILTAPGVSVAELENVDPEQVVVETLPETFSTRLDVIGHDWKTFDFMEGWLLRDSVAYVVKTAAGQLYKLVFIDFEGSSTGVATFQKSDLGVLTNTRDVNSVLEGVNVYPNPVVRDVTVTFSLKKAQQRVLLMLFNTAGQRVWSQTTDGVEGLNALNFSLPELASGTYSLNIRAAHYQTTHQIIIK